MADLAVGLSKTVVEGVLARIQTAIEEDAKLRRKAERDLGLISLEFEMIQSFLNIADDEISTAKNKLLRIWVSHVRELADDLEDCIDFAVGLDGKPIFWRRLLPSCIAPVLPLDQAVAELEDLKDKAKDLSKRYMRYSHITDAAGSKVVMLQQQGSSRVAAATASSLLSKAKNVARSWQGLGDLTQLITKKLGDELQVISVWGTGGDFGTTSVIREAYNDPEISRNFACRAWIKLTHPFNPHEFVRRFMAQVNANACQEQGVDVSGVVHVLSKMKAKQEHLLKEFVEEVKFKTYLVVLDNLTDMADWDAVRAFLPDIKNGSSIIVATQQLEIASLCIGHSFQPLELKQLSPDHSICAFFKEGSQDYGNKEEKSMVPKVIQKYSYGNMPTYNMEEVQWWMQHNPLVGRESQMNELYMRTYFGNSRVIPVWGIAGIGKSALVRNFYYDRILHCGGFEKYSWVDVPHPFNLRVFSRSLLSDHHSDKDHIKESRELLSQHRCLVVIDDLWSKEEWDLIQAALISRHSSSIIIVITTEPSIATYCVDFDEDAIDVKGLQDAAAIELFMKEVYRKNPSSALNGYNGAELDELVLKCGGLPKVIVSIAALLATQTVTLMDSVRSLNGRFMHHLETNPEYDSLRDLFDWMQSYFRTFPDSLKPCIFYLSVFPPHHNIRRGRLVMRWIAEDYCRDTKQKSALDKGETLFSWLHDLSIIQEIPQLFTTAFGDRKVISRQVNSFIREYIISRRLKENLVFELGPNCVLTTQVIGRHLLILKGWDRDRTVFENIDFSRLRSLTVFGKWESFFISKQMRLLRVLDLEDASGVKDEDLEKMVMQLERLKFLSLRGCSGICHLPSSLGDLWQLQTLDARDTSIVTLPASIVKLQKLQYIRVGTSIRTSTSPASSGRLPESHKRRDLLGVKVPKGIGKLMFLHRLGVINVGASGGMDIVVELKKLTQLRKLGVSGMNKAYINKFFSETSGLVHLESLLIQLDKYSTDCMDDICLPGENLQSLTLYGLQDKLPPLWNTVSRLRKLDLEMDTLERDDMEFLGSLPELCILRLQVKQLQPENGKLHFYAMMYGVQLDTFKKVKILEVACGSSWLHITFGSRSMKSLELLKIDCSSASYQLTGLNHLSELKEVLLKGTDDEEIMTHLETQLANHPKAPTVKLEGLPQSS